MSGEHFSSEGRTLGPQQKQLAAARAPLISGRQGEGGSPTSCTGQQDCLTRQEWELASSLEQPICFLKPLVCWEVGQKGPLKYSTTKGDGGECTRQAAPASSAGEENTYLCFEQRSKLPDRSHTRPRVPLPRTCCPEQMWPVSSRTRPC